MNVMKSTMNVTISLPVDLLQRIDQERELVPRSAWIAQALRGVFAPAPASRPVHRVGCKCPLCT